MKKILLIGLVSLIFALNCFPQNNVKIDLSNMDKSIPTDKDVKIGVLQNGMKYFIRKNKLPENRAHFRLVIKAGAIQEDDDQNGLAHFVEHMAFNGTKNFPKNELVDFLQKNGVTFGADINASTGLEQTMYELPIQMNDEKLLINSFKILSDWACNMSFDNDQIDGERGVILSEWRQRNNYQFRIRDKSSKYIYKDSKWAKRNIIGDTSLLKNFKYDVIKRFYKDWYRPDLMALVAVGDFDVAKIESLIKEYFGSISNPNSPRKKEVYNVNYHKETIAGIVTDKELPYNFLNIYFKIPDFKIKSYSDLKEYLKRDLFDVMFNERIQDLSKIANPPFIQAGGNETRLNGDMRGFYLYAVTAESGIAKGLDAIITEAARIKQHGFTLTELERAKKSVKANFDKDFAERNTLLNNRYIEEYTYSFTNDVPSAGIEFEQAFVTQILPFISLEEINSLANLYIKKENTVIISSFPEDDKSIKTDKEILALFNKSIDKKTEPFVDKTNNKPLISHEIKAGKIIDKSENSKLEFNTYTLSNGAKVILKKTNFKDDEIIFDIFSKGGYSYLDDKMFEKCKMAENIISNSGLADFDQQSLEKMLTGKMIQLNPYINDYTEGFQGSSSKNDLETAMQLVHLYFTAPRKDNEAFNSYMTKLNGFLASKSNNPESVFDDSSLVTLYNHNKRKQPLTSTNINQVNADEMYKFFKDRFKSADDFTFVIVGDIDLPETEKFIEKYIASLPSNGQKENYKDIGIRYNSKSVTNRFSKGKQERTQVMISIPTDFQWNALNRQRINSMVDLLRIKVQEIIREKMAGIYSPSVYANYEEFPVQTVTINIEYVSKPEMTDDILKATFQIFEDLKNNEDEIGTDKVKKAQKKSFETRLKNNQYWLFNLAQYIISNEDLNNFLKYPEYISSLTPNDIKEKAKKHLIKEKAIVLINEPEK